LNINKRLDQYLFDYRISTHTTAKESPSKLLLGRNLRTRFDLLKLNIRTNVHKNQEKQINSRSSSKKFEIDEIVLVLEYVTNKWIKRNIKQKLGNVIYVIELESGILCKRHTDQLLKLPL